MWPVWRLWMNGKLLMSEFEHVTIDEVMDACAILDAIDIANSSPEAADSPASIEVLG